MGLDLLAAFNTGISGGAYGPVVTTDQMLSGINSKAAIAICSLAEGVTSLAGLSAYFLGGQTVDWTVAPSLAIGSARRIQGSH